MDLAIIYSRACLGIQAPLVTVETHISNGLPALSIVGLPEAAVRESKDRVRSALINSGFEFPVKRITINLAPADLPKEGGRFDLPIALGILAASKQIPSAALEEYEFAGELALTGELRPIHAVLPFALGTRSTKRALILPEKNAEEASLPGDICVLGAKHLIDVYKHLNHQEMLKPFFAPKLFSENVSSVEMDLKDVRGQVQAKRALEIAASGGHSLLMIGPPGSGKTMLATRLPGILPPLTNEESLEVMAIYSLVKGAHEKIEWRKRPFRNPHHTASNVALAGGGSIARPGEISLAHNGVLFLDELPEFDRHVLEVLREPLESGSILISRAARKTEFPAAFQLIAAMNPCPCGYLGDLKKNCRCTADQIKRYRNRISGPLLDRIDMHIEVSLPQTLQAGPNPNEHIEVSLPQALQAGSESSEQIRARVVAAAELQKKRCNKLNAKLSTHEIQLFCNLDLPSQNLMQRAAEQLGFSARSYHRILRTARTIADLAQSENILSQHLAEALHFRKMDRHSY